MNQTIFLRRVWFFTFCAFKDSVFLNYCHGDGVFSEYGAPEEGELKKWEAVPLTKELIS